MTELAARLDKVIGKIPHFPRAGILYYDITGILKHAETFQLVIDHLAQHYRPLGIKAIAAIESRGFIFAAPLALQLQLPLVLARKAGKLPGITVGKSYSLEYGSAKVEVHLDDIPQQQSVLVVDDLLASGGTMAATVDTLRGAGAIVNHVCAIIGLPQVGYRDSLPGLCCYTLIDYR